jgi:hypothetical protein
MTVLFAYLGTYTEEYKKHVAADVKNIVPFLHYAIWIIVVLFGIIFTIPLSLIVCNLLKKEKRIIRIIFYIFLASVASLLSALHSKASVESVLVFFVLIGVPPTLVEIINGKYKAKTA